MTMLMHSHSPFEQVPASKQTPNAATAEASAMRAAAIKRFCFGALTVLAAFGALTAVIALKAAIYYWRFH